MARIARVLISPEMMRQLMCLPAATEILGSSEKVGYVEIVLTHPDLADVLLSEGQKPPMILPAFTRLDDGTVTLIDWGQS